MRGILIATTAEIENGWANTKRAETLYFYRGP